MVTHLEDLVGSKLVIGFPGTKVTAEIIDQFRRTHAGGVIFFRINFDSPEQIRNVITQLENALQRKLLVCVDHEGGRVIMYRDGITVFPDNMAFGRTRKIEYAQKAGEIAAQELRALGTDINFAPTLDVLTGSFSPNIGIRAFGGDWKLVSDMGVAYIRALQKGGVSATAKHFPGQGHSTLDAHLSLPTINSTWTEMNQIHLQPFVESIKAGVDVIMTSHPRYPRLDPVNIATFSRRIVTDCLRDELNFKGIISSDDLEMGAIREICPIDVAAVKTAAAGHDLILSCHDFESEMKCYQGLFEAYKSRFLPLDELEESADRIEQIKKKHPQRFAGKVGPHPEGVSLALKVAFEGLEVIQDSDKILPLPKSLREQVGIIFPKLSSLASKIMVEKEFEDEKNFFHHYLGHFKQNHVVETYKIDADEEDIRIASDLSKRMNVTVFYCYDAHLFPSQGKLLQSLQQSARKLIVVLLRDPYDRKFLTPQDTGLTAFGWRKCQIEACTHKIFES
ncbi:MAG: beta-N-acetylhexosaminidase [Elusimicrobiota bacterium]